MNDHEENARKILEEHLHDQLKRERRIVEKRFKRAGSYHTFPYRMLQEADRGAAAFIPSYRPYTKDDMTLLLAAARANGGLLPVKIRMALLERRIVEPVAKPHSLMAQPDHSRVTRNRLKRLRKAYGR